MKQARVLFHDGGNYALAMYCGGLAVECVLRAFRWAEDQSFEGRHDLDALLRASKLLSVDEQYLRWRGASEEDILESVRRLRAAMSEVSVLWNNSHRFASEKKL
jgi:HEPN domain-containing protein